jgi:hypothetical protein
MRTLFTALAFLVMLLAVLPAIKRCLAVAPRSPVAAPPEQPEDGGPTR